MKMMMLMMLIDDDANDDGVGEFVDRCPKIAKVGQFYPVACAKEVQVFGFLSDHFSLFICKGLAWCERSCC